MRVLLCVYSCDPNRGREQGSGWNSAWHLAQLGHEVWALTKREGQASIERTMAAQPMPNLHFVYIDDHPFIAWLTAIKSDLVKRLNPYIVRLGYLLWHWQAYAVAKQLDRDHDFEIVHHLTMSVITGGSLLWKLNKPFMMGPVGGGQIAPPAFKGYFQHWWPEEARRSFIIQKLIPLHLSLRKAIRHTDLILAINSDTADLAKQLGAKQTELFLENGGIPKGFLLDEIPVRPPSPELRLLWVAVLEPRKGLVLALEALSKVDPAVPFKLTILGSGPQGSSLPGLIQQYNLEGKVDYRGYVAWTDVFNAYQTSDALIFPSLRDTFGVQLFEAMSQGLPLISLNHQGAGAFVPEAAGIKVPVTTPAETVEGLAKAIEYLYHHPDERLKMGRAGYDFTREQTWDKRANQIVQYYETILAKRSQSKDLQPV
ncbi:glycosyltransferase [Oculatella sp. LEGE 06141]|uniref:glycosyltransferase family 4 protein n=1 Tax=Oculatella sp. LEGE 06141 TaxID=1828648 RepID=UPI00187EF181|nr:glycosyltransferase [Oculatella sp. LEGE 06141]MBE9179723.1 glycosyltransferase [Oculatella sp. LEGE 06141]